MNWQPIADFQLPPFEPKNWYVSGPRILAWTGHYVEPMRYGYTQKGKGRWTDTLGRVANPTHWMPMPDGPTDTSDGAT